MTLTAPLRELLGKATPGLWAADKREFGWWMSAVEDKSLMPGELPFEDARAIVALRNLAEPYIVDVIDALGEAEERLAVAADALKLWPLLDSLAALLSALDREGLR